MQDGYTNKDSLTLSRSEISGASKALTSRKENGLLREVFPAKTFPSLVKALGWLVSGQDSGLSMLASLASYDRESQSWKTSELSLFGGSTPFSGAFPKSGMMRNGRIYELPMSERPTEGNESGLWPTPRANDSKNGAYTYDQGNHARPRLTLTGKARMFPTPTVNDAKNSLTASQSGRGTLTARMVESGETGYLNPMWVEWLQGYPMGWTDLNALGIALSLK